MTEFPMGHVACAGRHSVSERGVRDSVPRRAYLPGGNNERVSLVCSVCIAAVEAADWRHLVNKGGKHTRHPDGRGVLEFPRGHIENDGTVLDKGFKRTIHPNGRIEKE